MHPRASSTILVEQRLLELLDLESLLRRKPLVEHIQLRSSATLGGSLGGLTCSPQLGQKQLEQIK